MHNSNISVILSQTLSETSKLGCKEWDQEKCKAIDYELSQYMKDPAVLLTNNTQNSYSNNHNVFRNLIVTDNCNDFHDYFLVRLLSNVNNINSVRRKISSCKTAPNRGLIIISNVAISLIHFEKVLVPYLEDCCDLSFDAISTWRLQKRWKDVFVYFFIQDVDILSIQRHQSLEIPKDSDNNFGILLSSNERFLGTAKSMMQVVRLQSTLPITVVVPENIVSQSQEYFADIPNVIATSLRLHPNYTRILTFAKYEYGFRLHKLPMLLLSPYRITLYLDSDVYVCGPNTINKMISEINHHQTASFFITREGKRKVDHVNYVHGGVLAWRSYSSLSMAFLRNWLRLYLVHYRYRLNKRGSIFEQPSLTLVVKAISKTIGDKVFFSYDENRLLRIHLAKGLDIFRNNYLIKGYAAELIHINPLKDWDFVEEFVINTGCGNFSQGDTNNIIGTSSRNNTNKQNNDDVNNHFRTIQWKRYSKQESLEGSHSMILYAIILSLIIAFLVYFRKLLSRLTTKSYIRRK